MLGIVTLTGRNVCSASVLVIVVMVVALGDVVSLYIGSTDNCS